jgi:gamma-glutamyltranspeptidase
VTVNEELHRLVDLVDDAADMEEAIDSPRWLAQPGDTLTPRNSPASRRATQRSLAGNT